MTLALAGYPLSSRSSSKTLNETRLSSAGRPGGTAAGRPGGDTPLRGCTATTANSETVRGVDAATRANAEGGVDSEVADVRMGDANRGDSDQAGGRDNRQCCSPYSGAGHSVMIPSWRLGFAVSVRIGRSGHQECGWGRRGCHMASRCHDHPSVTGPRCVHPAARPGTGSAPPDRWAAAVLGVAGRCAMRPADGIRSSTSSS
jgi:hypothetical protein